MISGAKSGANFSLKAYCNLVKRVEVVILLLLTVHPLEHGVTQREELINEYLEQFIGEYTKPINLSDNAKGIYFFEIETDKGIVNKKLILQ